MDNRHSIKLSFLKKADIEDHDLYPIQADASFRTYDRVKTKDKSLILMNSPPEYYDLTPFIEVAELLRKHNLPAPEIFHIDIENGFMLLEDFGCTSIKDHLLENPREQKDIYKKIIALLAGVQKIPSQHLKEHSVDDMLKGIEVYIDWYIPHKTGKPMDAHKKHELLDQWRSLLHKLPPERVLALRDFHVENLMHMNGKIGLLDFQDATLSHRAYDLVSLLEDARYDVPEELAKESLEYYFDLHPGVNRSEFLMAYKILGAQRGCRVLGVFARKAMRDGVHKYLELIPRVKRYLNSNDLFIRDS